MTVSVMPAVREQLIHVPVGTAILAGTLRLPRDPEELFCLRTAVVAAGTAPAIAVWHSFSTKRDWRRC
jgi:hypothetical protein